MPIFTTALLGGLAAQGLQVANGIDQANQAEKARKQQAATQSRALAEQDMQSRRTKQKKRALDAQSGMSDTTATNAYAGRQGGSLAPALGVPGNSSGSKTILGG